MAFEKNVFVNCPFDENYLPLLRPLLFTVIFLGLKPRIALEAIDSGELRLQKIVSLIKESKFSIHDLSRSEAAVAGELYRLNMPFELGIDFGCRFFGNKEQRKKRTLILETKPHRYKASISDLAGADIECHSDDPYKVFSVVRNWLKNVGLERAIGPMMISSAFDDFMTDNFNQLSANGFSPADIESHPIAELMEEMTDWVVANAEKYTKNDRKYP
jgi:hypothetical protein